MGGSRLQALLKEEPGSRGLSRYDSVAEHPEAVRPYGVDQFSGQFISHSTKAGFETGSKGATGQK